jgi:hypothetical protein
MYSEKVYSDMTLAHIWIHRMWIGSSMNFFRQVILILKSFVSLDIVSYSPVVVDRHFRGTYHPCIQDWGMSQTRNLHEGDRKESSISRAKIHHEASRYTYAFSMLVFNLAYSPICESAGFMFLHSSVIFTGLYSILSKMELFITASVRTSNPTIKILIYS